MTVIEEICSAWRTGASMDRALSQFVIATASRASGCWRLEEEFLRLVGFGWASDMPDAVSTGFQEATRRVALDQTGLGIVKAVVSCAPAIGHLDSGMTGLDGSASWIARFGATSSLAVPIWNADVDTVVGVIAISTADDVAEGDMLWQTMVQISEELGKAHRRRVWA